MYRELIAIEFHRIKKAYAISFAILLGYVLFTPKPHTTFDLLLLILSSYHGGSVGNALFNVNRLDSFLFTLPINRTKLFLIQLASGGLLILFGQMILFIVLAIGLRSFIHQSYGSIYFPAITWYELWALPTIIYFSYLSYFFAVHGFISTHFLHSSKRKRKLAKEDERALKLIGGIFIFIGIVCMIYISINAPRIALKQNSFITAGALFFGFLSIIMTTVSAFAFRYVEIDPTEQSMQ